MELSGALSNLDLAGFRRLDGLRARLVADAPPGWVPVPLVDKKVQRGWVLAAVARVLGEAQKPMRMCEVRTRVEGMLGRTVSKSSVMNALASNSFGTHPRFERVERGRYRIVP